MESKFYILSNLVILSTSSLAAEFFLAAELTTSFFSFLNNNTNKPKISNVGFSLLLRKKNRDTKTEE